MSGVDIICSLNLPELLELSDAGLDDSGVDSQGRVYVSDGLNGRVYRISPSGETAETFDVMRPALMGADSESSLNLSVAPDSTFCLSDAARELVVRYDENGSYVGEFSAPGVLSLCHGPNGLLYVLSNDEGIERINCYDEFGFMVNTLPAPARHRACLEAGLVNLECGPDGSVYVSYGMPPYRLWKVRADGEEIDAWSRPFDHPEDAVLVADIALDSSTGILWALLACKRFGQQVLDAFSTEGGYLGSVEIPHSQTLFGMICSAGGSELYLLDTDAGPGAGNLLRVRVEV